MSAAARVSCAKAIRRGFGNAQFSESQPCHGEGSVEIVLGWIIFSVVAGWIASTKGRSFLGVFGLSLLLSPLVGLIVAFALKARTDLEKDAAIRSGSSGQYRKCPFCAEVVRIEAIKCKHCGSALEPIATVTRIDAPLRTVEQQQDDKRAFDKAGRTAAAVTFGVFAVLALLVFFALLR